MSDFDNNKLDFVALSERIAAQTEAYNAQTEAYIDFTNALAKIIDQLKDMSVTLNSVHDDVLQDAIQKLIILHEQFKGHVELSKERNAYIVDQLEDYNSVLSHLGGEIERLKEKTDENVSDIIEKLDKQHGTLYKVLESHNSNSKDVNNHLKSIKEVLTNETNTKINQIINHNEGFNKDRQGWKDGTRKVGIILATISSIVVFIGMLLQFGIIKIDYFPSNDHVTHSVAAPPPKTNIDFKLK